MAFNRATTANSGRTLTPRVRSARRPLGSFGAAAVGFVRRALTWFGAPGVEFVRRAAEWLSSALQPVTRRSSDLVWFLWGEWAGLVRGGDEWLSTASQPPTPGEPSPLGFVRHGGRWL